MNALMPTQPDKEEPITEPALKPEDSPTVIIDKHEPEGDPDQNDDPEETDEDAPAEPFVR